MKRLQKRIAELEKLTADIIKRQQAARPLDEQYHAIIGRSIVEGKPMDVNITEKVSAIESDQRALRWFLKTTLKMTNPMIDKALSKYKKRPT